MGFQDSIWKVRIFHKDTKIQQEDSKHFYINVILATVILPNVKTKHIKPTEENITNELISGQDTEVIPIIN